MKPMFKKRQVITIQLVAILTILKLMELKHIKQFILVTIQLMELERIELSKLVIARIKPKVIQQQFQQQVIKHIKRVIVLQLVIKRIRLIKQAIIHIKPIKPLIKVNELFIFQQLDIQLFLRLFLEEYIQHIYLKKLKVHTQSNIQLHNNQ